MRLAKVCPFGHSHKARPGLSNIQKLQFLIFDFGFLIVELKNQQSKISNPR